MRGKTNYVRDGRKGQTADKWLSDLWFKAPEHDKEIVQGHDFHDSKLIQDEYLRNLDMIDPMYICSDTYQMKDYRNVQEEPKFNKMSKLRREVDFLEKGMQRVRMKLKKLQQDPTLTPSRSTVGVRPKQFVDQHDYHKKWTG